MGRPALARHSAPGHDRVELRVGKRLSWVGGAACPLRNIARVYTFTLHPRRTEAVFRFLTRTGITLPVAIGLSIIGGLAYLAGETAGPSTAMVTSRDPHHLDRLVGYERQQLPLRRQRHDARRQR